MMRILCIVGALSSILLTDVITDKNKLIQNRCEVALNRAYVVRQQQRGQHGIIDMDEDSGPMLNVDADAFIYGGLYGVFEWCSLLPFFLMIFILCIAGALSSDLVE